MLDHDYPYPCVDCSKRFKRNDHLKKHVESVHSQIKYTCSYCDKKISRKDHLKRHIGNVHPSMVYSVNDSCSGTSSVVGEGQQNVVKPKKFYCEYCHEGFSRKDHVTRHIRSVHHNLVPSQQPSAT